MMLWASEYLYSWSIALTKLAVLSFYRRLFQFSSIRIPIIVLMVMCGIWITLRTFITTFHCLPVHAYWDKSIPNARCITHIARFYLGTDLTHCLLDFMILALPVWEIIRMRLPFGQKIAVLCLFALGSLYVLHHSSRLTGCSHEISALVLLPSSRSSSHKPTTPIPESCRMSLPWQ